MNKTKYSRHGDCSNYKETRLYSIWKGMKTRCNNPNRLSFKRYGGRGIKLCQEWNVYTNFKN